MRSVSRNVTVRLGLGIAAALVLAACDESVAPAGEAGEEGDKVAFQISPDSAVLGVGEAKQFAAMESGESVGEIVWQVRSSGIASVDEKGVVQAKAEGETWLVAERKGSKGRDSVKVHVRPRGPKPPTDSTVTPPTDTTATPPTDTTTPPPADTTTPPPAPAPVIARITIEPASATIDTGKTVQLKAVARDSAGTAIAATFTWASSAKTIATVSTSGLVKGIAAGKANVSATTAGKSASIVVTVNAPVVTPPPTEPPPTEPEPTEPPPADTATPPTSEPPPVANSKGIWLSKEELMSRPTSGAAWQAMLSDASRDPGSAAITDQHSMHDTYVMAQALVCARTGQYCDKAQAELLEAIGSEIGADWHSVARNLGAYVIAADVMGLHADGNASSVGTKVHNWIASFLTRTDIKANAGEGVSGTRKIGPFHSGSNSAAQEAYVHAAVAAYTGNKYELDRSWDAFRTFSCDPSAPDREKIDLRTALEWDWEHDEAKPCGVNPKGTTKTVPAGRPGAGMTVRIDGAIPNDMRRGGMFQWTPGWTQYPWTGLQGYVPAALILYRAGYPAFEVADRAVYRTHEYLKYLEDNNAGDWFDGVRGAEVIQLVNWYYKSSFPMNKSAVGASRTYGYSDWTHPNR